MTKQARNRKIISQVRSARKESTGTQFAVIATYIVKQRDLTTNRVASDLNCGSLQFSPAVDVCLGDIFQRPDMI